jgi:PIN domain nuclease of toxin-antitoxin system
VILLDTHVAVWLALTPERISSGAADAIRQTLTDGDRLCLSAATVFEVANAIRRGRIQPAIPAPLFLERFKRGFRIVPVSEEIAACAGQLEEPFHGDPMDRMIAATAIVENCALLTADERIRDAQVCRTVW